MPTGRLVVRQTKKGKIIEVAYTNAKGQPATNFVARDRLHPDLQVPDDKLAGLEVEFDPGVQHVRPRGVAWPAPEPAPEPPPPPGDFHNPYNFVPAPPRPTEGPLADSLPAGHDRYRDGLWSGRIEVTLTTKTPLLLPGLPVDSNAEHKRYPVRMVGGKPYLAPTSVKGMLRSAYEAVTNSRFGVFASHDDRLAYRMEASRGLRMVPVRVVANPAGGLIVHLMPGTSTIQNDGRPAANLMYAAWLPQYNRATGAIAPGAIRYPGGNRPSHGEAVDAWLEEYSRGAFRYWRVRAIAGPGTALGAAPGPGVAQGPHQPTGAAMIRASGFVCMTEKNIERKHDERMFFVGAGHPQAARLSVSLGAAEARDLARFWRELVMNYKAEHAVEVAANLPGPPALGAGSVWSRHIKLAGAEDLVSGTLAYAAVTTAPGGAFRVIGLYPVMIARDLHKAAPATLVDASLRPAPSPDQLSPADRVFGWVNQRGAGAWRGQLRLGPVTCSSPDPVEQFPGGLPLSILGAPKPQQARFYVARDGSGRAQQNGLDKASAGYSQGKGLRGRKVYPHQPVPEAHWQPDATPAGQDPAISPVDGGTFREYLRPRVNGEPQWDKQNRSVLGWVKPGASFSFDIDVINLSDVELGALLWLLSLDEGSYHRLGGGKPLGFGSVRLEITGGALGQGSDWKAVYSSLAVSRPGRSPVELASGQAESPVAAFRKAVEEHGKVPFATVPFIAAFLRACRGPIDGLPTHYPRGTAVPNPAGESFRWFVANEAQHGPKLSLPSLDGQSDALPLME
jgi:CRISPR-associated protein (TIGR03986 family)